MKKEIRKVIIARRVVEEIGKSKYYHTSFARKYANVMAIELMDMAKKTHRLLPYYLTIKAI